MAALGVAHGPADPVLGFADSLSSLEAPNTILPFFFYFISLLYKARKTPEGREHKLSVPGKKWVILLLCEEKV